MSASDLTQAELEAMKNQLLAGISPKPMRYFTHWKDGRPAGGGFIQLLPNPVDELVDGIMEAGAGQDKPNPNYTPAQFGGFSATWDEEHGWMFWKETTDEQGRVVRLPWEPRDWA